MESPETSFEKFTATDLAHELRHLLDAEQSTPEHELTDWRQQVLTMASAIDTQREIGSFTDDDRQVIESALEQFLASSHDTLAQKPIRHALEQLRD